jgi:DNA-binding CsgD family transcriptional regulator
VHVASYREAALAEIECAAGRLADAEAQARTAWEILRDLEPVSLPVLTAVSDLMIALIARGHLDEATELAEGWDFSAPFSVIPLAPPLLHIRGTLRLARGELGEGAEDLVAIGEDLEAMRMLNPAAIPWRQHVVPALGALDRTAEARRIVSDGLEQAHSFGAGHVIGTMLRARASIETKRRRISTLRESVAALEPIGPPHELAHSCLELGAALRRDGQRSDSREPLRRALELAHTCGADGLERRAREELAVTGSRPRSAFRSGVRALTASELRTARLAGDGLSNVEIAQQLFVTRKTVEKHLGNAYTKLEIPSRKELASALAAEPD